MHSGIALLVADLVGVAVFAASGASAAVVKRLDLFGVIFVGFVAALGGGIVRDLAIDRSPPLAFADWRYAATATAAALLVFWFHPQLTRLRTVVLVLDAAGLALFTVTGTLVALAASVPALGACLLGMLTGIGGGLGRDLLTGEIPVVLRREIYAVAALLGAVAVVILHRADVARPLPLVASALLVFGLRLVALRRRWSVPLAATGWSGQPAPDQPAAADQPASPAAADQPASPAAADQPASPAAADQPASPAAPVTATNRLTSSGAGGRPAEPAADRPSDWPGGAGGRPAA